MPHIVLGDAAVQIPVDTRLNGNAQSGGGAAADVAPSLPIVGAALPLVGQMVNLGGDSKDGVTTQRAEEIDNGSRDLHCHFKAHLRLYGNNKIHLWLS